MAGFTPAEAPKPAAVADATMDLRAFREQLYASIGRRADALFALTDAILSAGTVPAPVHLSLQPVHRRAWTSLYAVLRNGRIDEEAAQDLLASQPPIAAAGGHTTRVYAVDLSVWPRCDAEASPERGYYHHPSRYSAGQSIVAGWVYQIVAQLGFERNSWVGPMDARRVPPEEDANDVAVGPLKALVSHLARRDLGGGEEPLFVFDAGYDPVRIQKGLEGFAAQIMVRPHSSRIFYADPPTLERRPVGRPFVRGKKFDLKDPNTWDESSVEYSSQHAGYGKVRVRAWLGLHPKTRRAGQRYGSDSAAVVRGTVVLVEIERLPRGERRRRPKKLWLWWHGEDEADLEVLWKSYVRRFDIEHAVKLLKSSLGWTTPRVRHPEQADRWTWLMLAA